MISPRLERLAVLGLLLLAVALRAVAYSDAPPGIADEELLAIDMSEQMRGGLIQVFYPRPEPGGQAGLFALLNMLHTALVGQGLFGYRLLSLWLGLVALALLYRGARMCFGPAVALVALAIMTSNIWAILLARSTLPAGLVLALVMAVFAGLAWAFQLYKPVGPYPPRTMAYTALGLATAAALYTDFMGNFVVLVTLLFIVYMWYTRQPVSRYVWSSSLFMLVLIAIIALPYLISVARNPSTSDIAQLWYGRPTSPQESLSTVTNTLLSLFLRTENPSAPYLPVAPLLSPFWFVLALAGGYLTVQRWREPAYALVLILLGVGLLPGLWLPETPPLSALLVAQPALMVLPGLGAFVIARRIQASGWSRGWQFVAALMAVALAWTVWQSYDNLVNEWPERPAVQTAYHADVVALARYLDAETPREPIVFCVNDIQGAPYAQPSIAEFARYHTDLPVRYVECRTAFVLANGGGPMVVLQASPGRLLEATAPIRFWLDQLQARPVDGLPPAVINRLDAENTLAERAGQLQLQQPLNYPREGRSERATTWPIRFGRNLSLIGYQPPPPGPYAPGDVLMIVSYWRIDGPPPARLGIFTRLHDSPQASPFAETNAMNVLSTGLRERDVLVQTNLITVPENLPPGDYIITMGAFDNNPLNQIPLLGPEGEQQG
ncbi:MAG: ArnT family glycosyltransferase, partial [Anaerolineales bacterium]